jgi:hypothetical protein
MVKSYLFLKKRLQKYPSIHQAGTSKKARMEASIYKFHKRWRTLWFFLFFRTTKYTYKVGDCRSYATLHSSFHQCFHSSSTPACVADGSRTMLKAAVLLVSVLLLAAASLPRAQAQSSTPLSLSLSTQLILGGVIVRAWDGLVNASQ